MEVCSCWLALHMALKSWQAASSPASCCLPASAVRAATSSTACFSTGTAVKAGWGGGAGAAADAG